MALDFLCQPLFLQIINNKRHPRLTCLFCLWFHRQIIFIDCDTVYRQVSERKRGESLTCPPRPANFFCRGEPNSVKSVAIVSGFLGTCYLQQRDLRLPPHKTISAAVAVFVKWENIAKKSGCTKVRFGAVLTHQYVS